jgi:hypothetical protein
MVLFENLDEILVPDTGEFLGLGSCGVRDPEEERREVRVGREVVAGGLRDDELDCAVSRRGSVLMLG